MPTPKQIKKRKEDRDNDENQNQIKLDFSFITEDVPRVLSGELTKEMEQNIQMINEKSLLGNIDRIVKENETPFGEGRIADISKDIAVFGYSPLKKLFSSGAHPISRISRGLGAGVLEGTNQAWNTLIDDPADLITSFVGPVRNDSDLFDIKALGFERPSDKLYWSTYILPKTFTQLVASGIGIFSGLGKLEKVRKFEKTSKKALRISQTVRGGLSGAIAEGVLSDPDEGTIIDTIFDVFNVHPSLENPVIEFLRHPQVKDTDPSQTTTQEILQDYENRLRKGTVGILEDQAFEAFLQVLKGVRKSPSLMKKLSRRMSARPDLHPSLDDEVQKVFDIDYTLKEKTTPDPAPLLTNKPLPKRLQEANPIFKFRKKIEGAIDFQAAPGTGTSKAFVVNNINLTFENDIAKALFLAGSKNKKLKIEAIQYLNSVGVKNSEELAKDIQTNLKLAGEGGLKTYDVKVPSSLTKKGKQITYKLEFPDTRGQGKFYHGSAKEIVLEEGGEAASSQNIYGNGFYTTDDLITGSRYQNKGKKQFLKPEIPIAKGIKKVSDLPYGIESDLRKLDITDTELNQLVRPGIEVPSADRLRELARQARQFPIDNQFSDGSRTNVNAFNKIADRLDELADNPPKTPDFKPVIYEIAEKQPVNFYDLDQSVDADLKTFINNFNDDPYENIVSAAVNDLGDNFTLSQLFDEIRSYANGRGVSSKTVIDEIFGNFQDYFKGKGFGGFTHQGGKLAGKNKRLHQVKIYFDPANQININKVDLDKISKTPAKIETTFNPKYIGDGSQESFINYILTQANDLQKLESAGNWPYKRTFKDMIEDASRYTPREVIEAAVRFNKRYGTGGAEDLPAILISMNQLVNTTGRNLYETATQLDQALATGNLKGYDQLKQPFAKELQVFRSLMLLNKNLKTIPAQTLAANKAAGGFAENAATLDDLARRTPTEKAIDQQQRIMSTPDVDDPLPDLPVDELIKMADDGDTKGLRKLVRLIQASNGDAKVLRKINDGWGWLRGGNEIFINNILSNPETHLVNIASTALNTLAGPIELFLANPLDAETRARAGFELYYMMSTFSDSMRLAARAFQIEDNIVNPSSMVQDAERFAVRVDSNHSAAGLINGLGTAIRIPSRFLLAEDELFKQINFRGYVGAKNRYNGMMKGLTGKDLDNYVNEQNEILFNAIETGSRKGIVSKELNDLLEEAQAYSAERTFTAPLQKGSLSGKISDLAQHPLGRVFFPFVRTPINLLKQTAYRTPGVNLFLDEYRQKLLSTDKAVRQRAIGQMYMGGAMWTGGLALAVAHDDPYAELAITGGGPKNFKLLEQKIADGWQPYSFRFLVRDPKTDEIVIKNGKPVYRYVSFQRFDPWSSFLTMSADFAEISGHITDEERETLANVMAVTAIRNLNNKTYLRGFTEINDLFNNPRKFERWLARRISDNINIYPALTREIKRGARYNVRHDKTVSGEEGFKLFQAIKNQYTENTPFLNGGTPPIRHQRTGRFKTYPVGYGVNDFNPIYQSTSHNNPLLMIENELEIILPDMNRKLKGGIELDNTQYAELVDLKLSVLRSDGRGNNVGVQQALLNVINTPKFQVNLQKFRGFENAEEIYQSLSEQGFNITLKEVKETSDKVVKENARDEMYGMLKKVDDIYKGLAIYYFKEKYPDIKSKYDRQRGLEQIIEKEVSNTAIQRMFNDSLQN